MTKKTYNLRFGIIALMVLVAAMSRLLPHPPNFTAVGATALFGAAYFTKKYWAFLIPFLALWISDLILNNVVYGAYFEGFTFFADFMIWNYIAFGLMILLGSKVLKKVKPLNLLGASLGASAIFFLVTNFGSWYIDIANVYPKNFTGLMAAYAAGLPYLLSTIVGDLFYVGVLFGAFELIKQQYPNLAIKNV